MRRNTLLRLQRLLTLVSLVALLAILTTVARIAGFGLPGLDGVPPQGLVPAAFDRQVALVSGHAGFDSGAVCTDPEGNVTLTEAEVNARITGLAAERLRRAGADVLVLDEYDPRLQGLTVDVLLSLHADSCIQASGYKAAYHTLTPIAATNQRLLACLDEHYGPVTGLSLHPNTVTHDMTGYHAFNRIHPYTPAAILEMGFLSGDHDLLVERPRVVARGVADSILCFLQQAGLGS